MKNQINSFEDLDVYQKLCKLHLEVSALTQEFPDFEKYELGSQLRRSSNSAPANLAEGWNNKHLNIYLEGINRAQGEIQETRHHISIAFKKQYVAEDKYNYFVQEYNECGKMLNGLKNSLGKYA
ncbi:MAG: four helix bundle protein [Candidatus Omnitrophota bacterium]